jgi:hypothetical protein
VKQHFGKNCRYIKNNNEHSDSATHILKIHHACWKTEVTVKDGILKVGLVGALRRNHLFTHTKKILMGKQP